MTAPAAVLERIARLQALADRGATEHERALAAQKADELAARYDLQPREPREPAFDRKQQPGPPPAPAHPFVADGIVITINFNGGPPNSTATGSGMFTAYGFGPGWYR